MIAHLRKYDETTARILAKQFGGFTRWGRHVWAYGDSEEKEIIGANPITEAYELSDNWIILVLNPEKHRLTAIDGAKWAHLGVGGWVDGEDTLIVEPVVLLEFGDSETDAVTVDNLASHLMIVWDETEIMYCCRGKVKFI